MCPPPQSYRPETRGWVKLIKTVPWTAWSAATHRPTLSSLSVQSPTALLCSSATLHCTFTHGCGAPATFRGQPPTMNVSEARNRKSPAAFEREFVVMALTLPPCGHISTLDELRRPGIT